MKSILVTFPTNYLNYSIPDRKELLLSDILTTSEYQQILTKEIVRAIESNARADDAYQTGYDELYASKFVPRPDQLNAFGIRSTGLVFYFNRPELDPALPVGTGYLDVPVDFTYQSDLKQLVKPELLEYLKEE